MAEKFVRPAIHKDTQDQFSATEVGVTHPLNSSFVRIRDNGDIEIMAVDGLGITMNVSRRNMTIIADEIKFLTKETSGLRWNNFAFNPNANNFSQPTLTQNPEHTVRVDLYSNVQHYVNPPSS